MITNDDIKKLETKFATKNDVKEMIAEVKDDIKEDIRELLVEFRSDIFNKIDRTVGGLAKVEDEQVVVSHQLSNHEDRITALESKSLHAN